MSTRTVRLLLAAVLSLSVPVSAAADGTQGRRIAGPIAALAPASGAVVPKDTGRVIVRFKDDTDASEIAALGLDDAREIAPDLLLTESATGTVTAEQYATRLRRTGLVESADPDYLRRAQAYTSLPDDPHFRDESSLPNTVDIPHARSWALRGPGSGNFDVVWPRLEITGERGNAVTTANPIKVAVIDTGFYRDHPDRGQNIIFGRDECSTYSNGRLTSDDDVTPVPLTAPNNSVDEASHGTITACEIGQATGNGIGGAGAAYDTTVVVYKVQGVWIEGDRRQPDLYPPGSPVIPDSALIRAIRRAADDRCRVLSMSLAEQGRSDALQDAVDYAHGKGCVIVAAAGNHSEGEYSGVEFPAACANVIAVGAYRLPAGSTTPARWEGSNFGSALDLMAPGVDIYGPRWDDSLAVYGLAGGYGWWTGTSMAAPYVSSAAALLLRTRPDLTPRQVESFLKKTAFPVVGSAVGGIDVSAAHRLLFEATAPVTSTNATGSHVGSFTVTLASIDEGSGVASTRYRLDGGPVRVGTRVRVGATGDHSIRYWAIDESGNIETPKTATFTITPRRTAVTISRSASSVRRGTTMSFSGSLFPARAGDLCRIYVKEPGSTRWTALSRRYVSTVRSTGRGAWSTYRWTAQMRGRHYFRMRFAGDDTYFSRTSSVSPTITVLVR